MSSPRLLDAATLRELLTRPGPATPRLLDVRTPAEFETLRIPGAHNIPLERLREHREAIGPHLDADVVLVCRSGGRAAQAAQALAEVGLADIAVLDGGVTAWEGAGGHVTRGRRTWELERQVRLAAGSVVAASVLGSIAAPRLKWLAGAVGSGLVVAAVTDSCALGSLLSRMPWNRPPGPVDLDRILESLREAS
jgi:rhodanese-related sulfurtransferase